MIDAFRVAIQMIYTSGLCGFINCLFDLRFLNGYCMALKDIMH